MDPAMVWLTLTLIKLAFEEAKGKMPISFHFLNNFVSESNFYLQALADPRGANVPWPSPKPLIVSLAPSQRVKFLPFFFKNAVFAIFFLDLTSPLKRWFGLSKSFP